MNERINDPQQHGLLLRQMQQLTLTPALKQSLKILAMPSLELSLYIQAQAEQNPVLEVNEYEEEDDMNPRLVAEHELVYDEASYEENWQCFLDIAQYEPHLYAAASREATPPELSAALPAREEQELYTLLRLQLALKDTSPAIKDAAAQIIEYLDEDGYLSLPLSNLAAESNYSEDLLTEALALVQSLEPLGVAARDLRECLRLQISAFESERDLLYAVIERHLPDVAANRVRETARALKISATRVEAAFRHIRALAPRPAAHYSNGGYTPYIIPDVIICLLDGEYRVFLNDSLLPQLYISPYYRRLDPLLLRDKEAADYIKRALSEADNLLRNIEKRRLTMYRLALFTLEYQRGFLKQGLSALTPLTMKETAQMLQLHESTISRAIAGKYIQTPRGLFPWNFFFPRSYTNQIGALTPAWAKEQLKELINAENKAYPLSDQRLSEILEKRGAYLARRTVAKYREELGIAARQFRRHR
jgi:RNA polymerase sigma-54 factor